MKTKRNHLITQIGNIFTFSVLALCMVLFFTTKLQAATTMALNEVNIVAQEKITLVGKVVDNNNVGVEGVIVKDNNSDVETLTSSEGKFTLGLDQPSVVSFAKIGFEVLEHEIAQSDSNLVVILTPESNELVVQGFDSTINEKKDSKSILDSLNTVESQPMFIIDGVKMELGFDINILNADGIESISVLKDSSSMLLYDAEAENGVVIIITKDPIVIDEQDSSKTLKIDSISTLQMSKSKDTTTVKKEKKDVLNLINKYE